MFWYVGQLVAMGTAMTMSLFVSAIVMPGLGVGNVDSNIDIPVTWNVDIHHIYNYTGTSVIIVIHNYETISK